jgi:hypothetical protein
MTVLYLNRGQLLQSFDWAATDGIHRSDGMQNAKTHLDEPVIRYRETGAAGSSSPA